MCARFIGAILCSTTNTVRDDVSHFVYITIEFDRLKRNKACTSKISFMRVLTLLLLVFSFIPYSSVLQLLSYICYGRCGREWDRIMWIFHWSKNFMNAMQLRATIANFCARERGSVVWIGNFSMHKIKVLAGKPNIIIEWRPLQICQCIQNWSAISGTKNSNKNDDNDEWWNEHSHPLSGWQNVAENWLV